MPRSQNLAKLMFWLVAPPVKGSAGMAFGFMRMIENWRVSTTTQRTICISHSCASLRSSAPKIVLVENVREFLNFGGGKFSSDLVNRFRELGYEVAYRKICAADCGVPQMRHRVFFVAVRCDVAKKAKAGPVFPDPEFFDSGDQLTLGPAYRTVRDAISDLPEPTRDRRVHLHYPERDQLSDLAKALRNPGGTVTNHFVRELSSKQKARIRAVGSGRMKHAPTELRTKSFYGSAYRRLSWDEPALTITTWVYHVGSGRFAHPEQDRGITMREAARLQTFDDGFVFPPLVNPVSQMIGNAVPPLLASKFAEKFILILDRFHAHPEIEERRETSVAALQPACDH